MGKCINYNILKSNELFHYQNSYPLISFILTKESEISNFSFLFYAFEEIFLSKKGEAQITKQIISKKVMKFFNKFTTPNFIPVIFEQNYFFKFLEFFEKIINKKENPSQQFFQNIILFFYNEQIDLQEIMDKINKEKGIFNNLVKKIHIFRMLNGNKYNKNIIGRMFKFGRILYTYKDFLNNCEKKEENEGKFIIYNIKEELLDDVVKKNNRNYLGSIYAEKLGKISIKEDECLIF